MAKGAFCEAALSLIFLGEIYFTLTNAGERLSIFPFVCDVNKSRVFSESFMTVLRWIFTIVIAGRTTIFFYTETPFFLSA